MQFGLNFVLSPLRIWRFPREAFRQRAMLFCPLLREILSRSRMMIAGMRRIRWRRSSRRSSATRKWAVCWGYGRRMTWGWRRTHCATACFPRRNVFAWGGHACSFSDGRLSRQRGALIPCLGRVMACRTDAVRIRTFCCGREQEVWKPGVYGLCGSTILRQ